jgi:hypothetical protein
MTVTHRSQRPGAGEKGRFYQFLNLGKNSLRTLSTLVNRRRVVEIYVTG